MKSYVHQLIGMIDPYFGQAPETGQAHIGNENRPQTCQAKKKIFTLQ
jgi:hypothetical protein